MIKVEELFIAPTATVLETLRKLDETGQRILFIAPEGHLKAVITDGDIRKFFLRGGTPDQTVDHAANYHPLSVSVSERGKARSILQEHCIDALPVLNKRGIITDIIFYTLYAVFIVVQGRRFVNGKTGFPRGKDTESPSHLFLALILQTRYNKIEYL